MGVGFALALSWTPRAHADPPVPPLSLEEAVSFALAHHPQVRVAHVAETVAAARIEAARTDLLPTAGLSAQLNRATGNVVPGALFPTTGIPTVAGPPSGRTLDGGAWGTVLGLWGSWDVTDLSRRMRIVDAALADERRAHAATDVQRLDIAFQAMDAFLGVVAAGESVRALHANVERATVLVTSVRALTTAALRPGADLARAESDAALATTQWIRAEQAEALRRAQFAEALGVAGQRLDVAVGGLLEPVPPAAAPGVSATRRPELMQADAAVQGAEIHRDAVQLEYLPRVDLVATLWLRGSGYFAGGANLGAAQGLLPDTPNWAAGVVVSWPVLEMFAIRARAHAASAQVAFERARREEIEQTLLGQIDAARALLDGTMQVARNTQPALDAARAAEQQATARYRAGLGTLLEVADAQRSLAQADLEDAIARHDVQRGRLLLARALGDLTPFVQGARAHAASSGRP